MGVKQNGDETKNKINAKKKRKKERKKENKQASKQTSSFIIIITWFLFFIIFLL